MLLIPFAVIALLLAAVGLYGLIAYSVQQRTQEIGVRMALGAGPEDVRFMVVLQGMRLAFLGILIGIPAALALTRVMVSMIFGIPTWDPLVLAAWRRCSARLPCSPPASPRSAPPASTPWMPCAAESAAV